MKNKQIISQKVEQKASKQRQSSNAPKIKANKNKTTF